MLNWLLCASLANLNWIFFVLAIVCWTRSLKTGIYVLENLMCLDLETLALFLCAGLGHIRAPFVCYTACFGLGYVCKPQVL